MFAGAGKKLLVNSSRKYLDDFAKEAASRVPGKAIVLDAGAGECPYRHHFDHATYESADFCQVEKQYGEITYVCDLTEIPVENQRFDLVLCTQTLEHVPRPQEVLQELHRILKPDGELWLSAPLFFEEHEIPFDFFRYTQYGLKNLLESAGFVVKRGEWLEGYYGTLSYQFKVAARDLPLKPKHYGSGFFGLMSAATAIFLKPLFWGFALLFSRLDLRKKYISGGHCKNYAFVAVKQDERST